ncbi:MAG: nucleotide sugar dehydrogenase, partial [candidate division Zixibacteria bacterium]|nr:nucleotide sugar dehydrogenase [candidate division Zixibacteria bacterium]
GKLIIEKPAREFYQAAEYVFVAIDSADRQTWRMNLRPFRQIARWLGSEKPRRRRIVVMKSTNILGSAEKFDQLLKKTPYGEYIDVAVSPEFLREGHAWEDTADPWRIVVGAESKQAVAKLARLYRSVYRKSIPIITDGWKTAELIKLASNLYLAHRLAYINEVAEFARMEGMDVDLVKSGISRDPRIGGGYFEPGLGFAGACLPKDCRFINVSYNKKHFKFHTAETALKINELVVDGVVGRIRKRLGGLRGKKVALLGTAFKPETDDTRESQALKLAARLRRMGAKVAAYDPLVRPVEGKAGGKLDYAETAEDAVRGASIVVIGTAHDSFRKLRPASLKRLMKQPVVCDNFRILRRAGWEKQGFEFV